MSAVRLAVAVRRAAARAAMRSRTAGVVHADPDRCRGTVIRLRLERTQPRSSKMHAGYYVLMEQLARHRLEELSSQAQRARVAGVVHAQRRARRAERSAQRAVESARLASQAARRAAQQLG